LAYLFETGGREWDAIHLYIVNNLDWMTKWIERCQQNCCSLTWEGVHIVTNISSRSDIHPQQSQNQYYGILDDIIESEFNTFKVVLFVVKWYRLQLNQNDPDRTVIQHDNRFTMINTRSFEPVGDECWCKYVFTIYTLLKFT
jgi:hypothetical protein